MCWVLFGVCAWILLLISSFHREAVEGERTVTWKIGLPFPALLLAGAVVLGHVTFLLSLMS